jgi:PIN domain nuclease of toxin-antitoxin system
VKLLLDTHVLLWWLSDARSLSGKARSLVASAENVVFVSAASIWEIRIKEGLGKVSLPRSFAEVLRAQSFEELSVNHTHAHAVAALPPHHRDPFDRILIAQARVEGLTFVTHDEVVTRYEVEAILV